MIAIQSRIQGLIAVKCSLDETGRVISSEITDVNGPKGAKELLGNAALENAKKWVFRSLKQGSDRTIILSYDFRFETKSTPRYLKSDFVYDVPLLRVSITAEIPYPEPEAVRPRP
jgi:TonB family protein